MTRHIFATAVAAALALASPAARAQTARERCDDARACTYVFVDDPMDARAFDANDVVIRVTPHAFRTPLVRPRVAFVTEMLESVEDL